MQGGGFSAAVAALNGPRYCCPRAVAASSASLTPRARRHGSTSIGRRPPGSSVRRRATRSPGIGWPTLTDTIGHRLSGSPQLDQAIQWALAEMKRDGLENVHAEKVMVPKWVRGNESADIVQPARLPLAMLGLGGSVGHASRRHRSAAPRRAVVRGTRGARRQGARPHRAVQRALHQLRRNIAVPLERRIARRAARRGRHAHPLGRTRTACACRTRAR